MVYTMINSNSTNAHLLEHVEELEAQLQSAQLQLAQLQPVPFTERLATVRNELAAAVNDAIRLERWCAKGFQEIVAELKALGYTRV